MRGYGTILLNPAIYTTQNNTPLVANSVFYRALRVDGTTAINIIGMNSSNQIVIDPAGSASPVLFGVTDNTVGIGDATHRVTDVQTTKLSMATSISNAMMGTATLSGSPPTAIVYNTAITATTTQQIFLSTLLARGAQGSPQVTTSTAGVSFTIGTTTTGNTSVIGYWIVPTT